MQKLRVSYVAGVTPGKWMDRFTERYPQVEFQASRYDGEDILGLLATDQADAVFVRYVGDSPKDATRHLIPLYEELEVVCAAKDHDVEYHEETIDEQEVAKFPQLDLSEYPEEAGGIPIAMEVVASGAQVLRVPQSIARLYQRKDVVYRLIEGGARTQIGIAWPTGLADTELVDEFIGIVRGRSANSSRQASVRSTQQEAKAVNDKLRAAAKEKAKLRAKQEKQTKAKARSGGAKSRKRR
ncbi:MULTISPECIES: LysR family transcriptional regulator substrate-binding protein [unclassified Arthrobacter]|uniref:LysR family transcriptional regulator substrate-binding protein n=1 Tax=unclassified Arthrobacter TaxID=235627 RepID=UPI0011B04DE0|nr:MULTISPECIES: LysR family transcriptional regulator substrate-binding protein [unclassified Arthrobacter]